MFEIVKKTFRWGNQTVTIETGEIARQATGAALVTVEGTVVLATVVVAPDPKPGQDFFPLTVDYVEKFYAAGRIPGGFLKREGRPTEREILTSRVIDRSVRPLFPSGFYNEVQVMVQVLSCDPSVESDIPALIAASSALALSGIPFDGPIGAAKVGYHNGEYLLNPAGPTLAQSALDLVVAGTDVAILMVESEARELPETIMLGAIQFGHEAMQPVIAAIDEIVAQAGKPDMAWTPPVEDKVLSATVATLAQAGFEQAYATADKQQRTAQIRETEHATLASLSKQAEAEGKPAPKQNEIRDMLFGLRARLMRQRILSGEPRIDGRNTRTVRPIAIRGGGLPRAHGSCLFTRGETQAWVSATLGTSRDEQIVDAISAEYRDRFIVHYNMPPFATGEVGRTGSPKRREIGHGNLMKRALRPLLPTAEDFAYSIRLVSEITESNGSSSMASVCGGCLALMDAGVPIRSHVAGIAMGLIKEGNRFAVLTDILGDEDYLGDMDFKIAGTATGITALQMDIKIQGITKEIMQVALAQGYEARMHVLARMEQAVSGARQELSLFAPRMYTMRINPDRIRDVIGKGGATIRQITEMTSTQIDIQDDGSVTIAAVDAEDGRRAQKMIEDLTEEVEVGRTYDGTVKKILTFGAIVQILAGREGLLHISEISNERDIQISDHLQQGQTIRVKVIDSDGEKGRFRLSLKAALAETAA